MATSNAPALPITSKHQLVSALEQGCKPKSQWRIGTEHEKFVYRLSNQKPVTYEEKNGIRDFLNAMLDITEGQPVMEGERIIGIELGNGGAISLEPAGQFELSGAPLKNLHETCHEANMHLAKVARVGETMDIGFLGVGMHPFWKADEVPQMPKERYKIMRRHMPKVGGRGLDMMHRSCTIQVNLDFSSEADMRKKMRIALALQPVATALFANSPFFEGQISAYLSYRSHVWKDVDDDRTGLLSFVFSETFGFEHYVDWALRAPMYFINRNGAYIDMTHMTFEQYWQGGYKQVEEAGIPTIADWEVHLTTVFPEARLKRFIEMRGADGGPWSRICGLPAFWVGLLYDDAALEAAFSLIKDWTYLECLELRNTVAKTALRTPFRGTLVNNLAKQALEIGYDGLKARNVLNPKGKDEAAFLEPLQECTKLGKTPAEIMLEHFHTKWNKDLIHIYDDYSF